MPRTEAQRAADAAYYAANKERIKARTNAYYHATKDERAETQKQRYEREKEAILAKNRQWAAKNREKMQKYHREYVKRNRDKWSAQTADYRASRKQATTTWANRFFMAEAYALAKLREKICGGTWHVDHIVPLQSALVCGLHVHNNLQVIPDRANKVKSNRHWPEMP
jgi:hypothetical protein